MANRFDLISPDLGGVRGPQGYMSDVDVRDNSASILSPGSAGISQPMQPGCRQLKSSDYLDKIERRRKRERESARRSRARKQIRVEGLEGRNAILEHDNQHLREQLRSTNVSDLIRERDEVSQRLQAALESVEFSQDESVLTSLVEKYHSITERISKTHIRAMKAISPSLDRSNLATAVLLMLLASEEDIDAENTHVSWSTIIKELGLSPEQIDIIANLKVGHKEHFDNIIRARQHFVAFLESLEQYNATILPFHNATKVFGDVLDKTLTRKQQATMTVWLHTKQDLLYRLLEFQTPPLVVNTK